jgi:putative ABC transport system ATP-binding protein
MNLRADPPRLYELPVPPGAESPEWPDPAAIAVSDLWLSFPGQRDGEPIHVLQQIDFKVKAGEFVCIVGPSGCGKTTLLNIIGGLDTPTSGTVRLGDRDLTGMSERDRMLLRRGTVSFIFQSFGLIPMLSAAENVGIPLRIAGVGRRQRDERVALMLAIVGLADHARQRPNELSGGQQQRVAIARALAASPQLLIADEPTGQLDSETGRQILRLLHTVVQSEGITALVATHDSALLELADSVLRLEDGQLAIPAAVNARPS